jgi:hypothetical protein
MNAATIGEYRPFIQDVADCTTSLSDDIRSSRTNFIQQSWRIILLKVTLDGTFLDTKGIIESGTEVQESHEVELKESVIVLRDISKEQAKREVQKLLTSSPKPLDHGEIADKLRLNLKLVAQVCMELIKEGVIEFA